MSMTKKISLMIAVLVLAQASRAAEVADSETAAFCSRLKALNAQRGLNKTDDTVAKIYNGIKNSSIEEIIYIVELGQSRQELLLRYINNTRDAIRKEKALKTFNTNEKFITLAKEIRGWVDV